MLVNLMASQNGKFSKDDILRLRSPPYGEESTSLGISSPGVHLHGKLGSGILMMKFIFWDKEGGALGPLNSEMPIESP